MMTDPNLNTISRAWHAAMTALREAQELYEHHGNVDTLHDLLRHAREMIDVIEAELAEGRAEVIDPDVARMAAAELRKRVEGVAATLLPLH